MTAALYLSSTAAAENYLPDGVILIILVPIRTEAGSSITAAMPLQLVIIG